MPINIIAITNEMHLMHDVTIVWIIYGNHLHSSSCHPGLNTKLVGAIKNWKILCNTYNKIFDFNLSRLI